MQHLRDSDSILLLKDNIYRKHLESFKQWYVNEYDNWHTISGEASQWWVWDATRKSALHTAQQIQQYLFQISSGKMSFSLYCTWSYNIIVHIGNAASVCGMCITPREFDSKLGEFIDYCPVSFALKGELVKATNKSLEFAAEYRYTVLS